MIIFPTDMAAAWESNPNPPFIIYLQAAQVRLTLQLAHTGPTSQLLGAIYDLLP